MDGAESERSLFPVILGFPEIPGNGSCQALITKSKHSKRFVITGLKTGLVSYCTSK